MIEKKNSQPSTDAYKVTGLQSRFSSNNDILFAKKTICGWYGLVCLEMGHLQANRRSIIATNVQSHTSV